MEFNTSKKTSIKFYTIYWIRLLIPELTILLLCYYKLSPNNLFSAIFYIIIISIFSLLTTISTICIITGIFAKPGGIIKMIYTDSQLQLFSNRFRF